MLARSIATLIAIGTSASLISACGAASGTGSTDAKSTTTPRATAKASTLTEASPTAAAAGAPRHTRHNFVGVATVQDNMGYRYRFEYDLDATFKAKRSIEYDVPGQGSIEQPITAQIYITSALPGRAEPLPFTAVSIDGLFKANLPICRAVAENNPEGVQVEKLSRPAGSYCDIPFATGEITTQPPTINLYQQITVPMLGIAPSDSNIAPSAQVTFVDALPASQLKAALRDMAQGPELWAVEATDPNGLDDWSHASCSISESLGVEVFAASWPAQIRC